MNKQLLEKFIDEEIVKDERYKELRKKCSDLSHEKNGKKYQTASELSDYCYRRLIFEKLLACFGEFAGLFRG